MKKSCMAASSPQYLSSKMLRAHFRNASDELDVFEASAYFSGEVSEIDLGLQVARRAEARRSFDTPKENTHFEFQPQKELENQFKDTKKHGEHSSPRGKLTNFVSSFFSQKFSRKKPKSVSPAQSWRNVECVERQGRRRNSSEHRESMMSMEMIPPPYLKLPLEEEQKSVSVRSHGDVVLVKDECRWLANTSAEGSSYNRAHWAEVFKQKEDRWCKRTEEEAGGGSDTSSDLFELKRNESDAAIYIVSSDFP